MAETPSFIKQRISSIYTSNKNTAIRLKSNFNAQVDPILQRLSKYDKSEIPKKTYAQNYFDKMKEKENELRPLRKGVTPQKTNVFSESDQNEKLFKSRKIFVDRLTQRSETQKVHSVRVFPTKLITNGVGKLLKQDPKEFDRELEKGSSDLFYNLKKRVNTSGKPSDLLKKVNDKKNLLPFEIEEMYDTKIRRNKSKHKEINTAERVFTEYVLTNKGQSMDFDKSTQTSTLFRSKSKRYYPSAQDNLGELLMYKHGPQFKSDGLTDKPNNQLLTSSKSSRHITSNSEVTKYYYNTATTDLNY